jgi:hypothetical protein
MNDDENRVLTKTEFVFSNEQHEYGAIRGFISMCASVLFIDPYSFRNTIIPHIGSTLVG